MAKANGKGKAINLMVNYHNTASLGSYNPLMLNVIFEFVSSWHVAEQQLENKIITRCGSVVWNNSGQKLR